MPVNGAHHVEAERQTRSRPAAPISTDAGPVIFRGARPRDVTALFDCLAKYFEIAHPSYPPLIETDAVEWGWGFLKAGGVVVAEFQGKIIGSFAVEKTFFGWNKKQPYLKAAWLFTLPRYRQTGAGVRLLDMAKEIADKNGLLLVLNEIWGQEPELMERFQTIRGFTHVGGNFLYCPPDSAQGRE